MVLGKRVFAKISFKHTFFGNEKYDCEFWERHLKVTHSVHGASVDNEAQGIYVFNSDEHSK